MSDNRQQVLWPGWETVRLIGRGSFGAVYEIQRDMFGETEKAALKVISIPQNASDFEEMYNDGYDDESITSTFQGHLKSIVAEYSLMRKMNGCSNVVSCDDIRYVQHDDGIGWDVFIKMELLTSLTRSLPDAISDELVIKIASDICAALELCAKHDIVHRDIKPQNIFVSPNGDYKLGDFGIAKTVEKTMGGTKIGTYKYMAPEVYYYKPYSTSADIYSLGLVLYWLLNDRRMPFLPLPPERLTASMEEFARERRLSGERIPVPAHGSSELKRIVLKACAYEPKDRFKTAKEMKNALNALCVGSSVLECVPAPYKDESDQNPKEIDADVNSSNYVTLIPEIKTDSKLEAESFPVRSEKVNDNQYRLDIQKALDQMHKEMDAYEHPTKTHQKTSADIRRMTEEKELRRKETEEEIAQRKERERAWADMIRLFRE